MKKNYRTSVKKIIQTEMDYLNYMMIALVVILTVVIIWLLSSKMNSSHKKNNKTANAESSNDNGLSNWSGSSGEKNNQ